MGYLTPIVVNNDTFHEIRQDPEGFVQAIARDMNTGGTHRDAKTFRADHSSYFRLIAVGGSGNARELSPYSKELIDGYQNKPWMRQVVRDDIKTAREKLRALERELDRIDRWSDE